MKLPFSREQFLDVFAAYNTAFIIVAVVFWLLTLDAVFLLVRHRKFDRGLTALQALMWGWAGIVYHAIYFSPINPAAWLFAALFLLEAVLFAWLAVSGKGIQFVWRADTRHILAGIIIAYALAYPFLALLSGHAYPRSPTFGVPCPTTLLTEGLLLTAAPLPRRLVIVPILWSVIGGSAALFLGVPTDYMLFVAGALLLVYSLAPRALGEVHPSGE